MLTVKHRLGGWYWTWSTYVGIFHNNMCLSLLTYFPSPSDVYTQSWRVGSFYQDRPEGHLHDVSHLDFSGDLDASAIQSSSIRPERRVNLLTGTRYPYIFPPGDDFVGAVVQNKDGPYANVYQNRVIGLYTFGGVSYMTYLCIELFGRRRSKWRCNFWLYGTSSQISVSGYGKAFSSYADTEFVHTWETTPMAYSQGILSVPAVLQADLDSFIESTILPLLSRSSPPGGGFTTSLKRLQDTPVRWQAPKFDIYRSFSELFPIEERNPDWREMAREAYQDLGFYSGNGIALTQDLLNMKEAASSTLATIRSLGSSKMKAVAQLFLSFHYGWRLTYLDLRELRDTLATYRKLRRVRSHQTREVNGRRYFATYIVDFDPWAQVRSLLDLAVGMFDLELRPHVVWDSIPFSFVVDWFVNLGDVLSGLDNYYSLTQRHRVVAASRSILCTRAVSPQSLGLPPSLRGTITCRYYVRKYGKALPPSLFPSVTSKFPWNHSVEGLALIVSRK